jgi:hypothetical protein
MSSMYVSLDLDEKKIIADAIEKSRKDRLSSPTGDTVVVHYHRSCEACYLQRHRAFVEGEEQEWPE